MRREKALFITLQALEDGAENGELAPYVSAYLRDHIALGYRVIIVTDRLELWGRKYEERELLEKISTLERHRIPITDLILLQNSYDPGPLWDVARRFHLSLGTSTIIARDGEYVAAARNAGVFRQGSSREAFGAAA
jgi:nicotinamidase-related amidase